MYSKLDDDPSKIKKWLNEIGKYEKNNVIMDPITAEYLILLIIDPKTIDYIF